ncbi:GNAT family N-acetyltransferase [Nocardiopsis changdeensis]|uniref:N-acetyltransferase n=1 Tax=Nocardiopsis changdeensis TaxID=2831969 RepID=A0ABX8BQH5_9ACTN|nr:MULTISPECIES: GNAT family N-acetyltransferase [Nocardiopsis]QUX24326.1 N-acetyltransferase [Nocardiopsis changdeensis]QYX34717.1 N-acetyltransferase [Nocardiopsis sp. MT53]
MADGRATVAEAADRYTISVDGEVVGFTKFVDADDRRRVFFHTEIDERFSGRGLAGTLVAEALAETRSLGLGIVPVCPYVARYVERHHEFDDALLEVTPDDLELVRALPQ